MTKKNVDNINYEVVSTFGDNNKRGDYHWADWLGGYPFEVAKPEELFHFYNTKGFQLVNMKTANRPGCNELVFTKFL